MTEALYLSCADTAKLVRAALKEQFPKIKFSMRSHTYSGGATVNVTYHDGPAYDKVEAVVQPFAGASFDGSNDMMVYRFAELNGQKVQFGADFVSVVRTLAGETQRQIAQFLAESYGTPFTNMDDRPFKKDVSLWSSLVWQYTKHHDFEGFCKKLEVAV